VARPQRLATVLQRVARGVGMPLGIVGGQAFECEPHVVLADYQRAKTGALFVAATMAGAESAGAAAEPWRALGECLGEAYQVADDIRDVVADAHSLGKPTGRDAALGRPSSARLHGLAAAARHFVDLVDRAVDSIPVCPGRLQFQALVRAEGERLVPAAMCMDLMREAA
jgi:geranylgeranyl diphosphate synthase type II